ncbi:uncharacterized protein [Dendrobates tinctorius]|uniref:uncharacterized protein isoform X1 n=1 Tax=Dendrobates tinctorius TaxID=92724 RepID=UPI003CC990B2
MDYFNHRLLSRERLILQVVGKIHPVNQEETPQVAFSEDDTRTMRTLFHTLEDSIKEEISNSLQARFLAIYMDEHICPKGLRISLQTPFPQDLAFSDEWEDIQYDCMQRLLHCLHKKRTTLAQIAAEKVLETNAMLSNFSDHPLFRKINSSISIAALNLEHDTIVKKSKKLSRDRESPSSPTLDSPILEESSVVPNNSSHFKNFSHIKKPPLFSPNTQTHSSMNTNPGRVFINSNRGKNQHPRSKPRDPPGPAVSITPTPSTITMPTRTLSELMDSNINSFKSSGERPTSIPTVNVTPNSANDMAALIIDRRRSSSFPLPFFDPPLTPAKLDTTEVFDLDPPVTTDLIVLNIDNPTTSCTDKLPAVSTEKRLIINDQVIIDNSTAGSSAAVSFLPSACNPIPQAKRDIPSFFQKVTLKRKNPIEEPEAKEQRKKREKRQSIKSNVFNLSSHPLSPDEEGLLSKGLSFCPSNKSSGFELFLDAQKFIRKLTLLRHFELKKVHSNPDTSNTTVVSSFHLDVRGKSSFYPLESRGHHVETFSDLLLDRLNTLPTQNIPVKRNLSSIERVALERLEKNTNLVIKSADKGGGIVIQDKTDYVNEAFRILSDKNFYLPIPQNPIPQATVIYNDFIKKAHDSGVLNDHERKFLTVKNPSTPFLYHLPKIHKSTINPPGRPIISGIDSLTSNLSFYIDRIMQPHVLQLPSFLKDSTQLINLTNNIPWKNSYVFISFDVSALYSNIDHQLGLSCFKKVLLTDSRLSDPQKDFIFNGMDFILHNNFFTFLGDFYHQIRGTAMGSRVAPTYANLFMGVFENTFITIDSFLEGVVLYKRYIDDLFLIFHTSFMPVDVFTSSIQNNIWGLEFTPHISNTQMDFLDITFYIKNSKIYTKTFFKKVDSNSYVHFKSSHYSKWLFNIPHNQFQRIRKNCTEDEDFNNQAEVLKGRFLAQKYPSQLVHSTFNNVSKNFNQQILLSGRSKEKDTHANYQANFITTYNSQHKEIKNILGDLWYIIQKDPVLNKVLPDKPTVTFRKARSLKNHLAPSRLSQYTPDNHTGLTPGIFRCQRPRCSLCSNIAHNTFIFSHPFTSEKFTITNHLSCVSAFVIYVILCPCPKLYVGRTTQPLHCRMNSHRHNTKIGYQQHGLSRHFDSFHQRDFSKAIIFPLEHIPEHVSNRTQALNRKEVYWIYKLKTIGSYGLNIINDAFI